MTLLVPDWFTVEAVNVLTVFLLLLGVFVWIIWTVFFRRLSGGRGGRGGADRQVKRGQDGEGAQR